MRSNRIRLVLLVFLSISAVESLFRSTSSSADQELPGSSLLEQTIITRSVEPVVTLEGLSQPEILRLETAKETMTEFLRRLMPGYGGNPLELLADDVKENYMNPADLFREHFQSELLISFRIFDYRYTDENTVVFSIFLRETLEGIDFIQPREIVLRQESPVDNWRILSIR